MVGGWCIKMTMEMDMAHPGQKAGRKSRGTIIRIRVVRPPALSSFCDESSQLVCLFCSFHFSFFLAFLFLLRSASFLAVSSVSSRHTLPSLSSFLPARLSLPVCQQISSVPFSFRGLRCTGVLQFVRTERASTSAPGRYSPKRKRRERKWPRTSRRTKAPLDEAGESTADAALRREQQKGEAPINVAST